MSGRTVDIMVCHDDELRVLVVDDDDRVRAAVVDLLGDHDEIRVVADCPDAESAMEVARAGALDAAVVDVQMPGTDGPALTRLLLAEQPGLVVLALSAAGDHASRESMRAAGAVGYYVKGPGSMRVVDVLLGLQRQLNRRGTA